MTPQGIGMDLVPISGDEEEDYGYKNHGHVDDDGNSEQEPDFADDTRRWRGRDETCLGLCAAGSRGRWLQI